MSDTHTETPLTLRGPARHRWLAGLAQRMAAQGAAEATIRWALTVEAQARCDPQPAPDEIANIASQAVEFETFERGQRASSFVDIRRYQQRYGRFKLMTDTEVEHLAPPTWLIEELFHVGTQAVLFGISTIGKTFVALDWSLCIATGREWCGRRVCQGPVVYVVAEGVSGFRARLLGWKQRTGEGAVPAIHFLGDAVSLVAEDDVETFVDVLRELTPRPILVVFDTLSRCMVGGEENSSRDMGLVVAAADRICKELGATVLLLHHPGKSGKSERGHGLLRGAADTMMELRQGPGDTKILVCEKQKDAETFPAIALSLEPVDLEGGGQSLVVVPAPDPDIWTATALTKSESRALEALKGLGGDASSSDWRTACGLSASTFYNVARGLCEKGQVDKTDEGKKARYRIAGTESAPTATSLPIGCHGSDACALLPLPPL